MNRPGRTAFGFGNGADFASATPIRWDDEAPSGRSAETVGENPPGTPCPGASVVGTAACPPDNYIPFPDTGDMPIAGAGTNLAQFDGGSPVGTWELCVADSEAVDVGTLDRWSLVLTTATPPQFSYTPTPPGPVNGVHTTGTIGSTANLTINVAIGTAGSGTGAAATTTTTCSAPPAPFAGFTQTPTAVGSGSVSPTSITGTCTVAATAQTATLNCVENRGGTNVPITFDLVCPAATNVPPNLTLTPPPGSTITGSGGGLIGSTANFSISGTVSGGSGSGAGATTTFSCTPPGAPFAGFTGTMQAVGGGALTGSPITGTCTVGPAPVTVNMTCQINQGGAITNVNYELVCPAGLPAAQPIDTLSRTGLLMLALLLLGFGAYAVRRLV